MECIYYQDLVVKENIIDIKGDTTKHCRALRLRPGEKLLITDGNGITHSTVLDYLDKESYKFKIIENLHNHGELNFRLGLAIGILENKDRFEFALEKAIELGITDFYPLICDHSQKKSYSQDRLASKAIAALEQCKRSVLTKIHTPLTVDSILSEHDFDRILLSDEDGNTELPDNQFTSTLVFVGPEGGFSIKELVRIKSDNKCYALKLGNRRLRAETAAVMAVGMLSLSIK